MPEPKTADEGLADLVIIHDDLAARGFLADADRLTEAVTPIVAELMRLRLENERLTAALHRKSEDRH